MKIGFIGAGKAGCSMGQYFRMKQKLGQPVQVTGYYSLHEETAQWAAQVTDSVCYATAEEVVQASDSVVISTPDGAIRTVWESMKKEDSKGRIFCHFSGSLSSDVFSDVEFYGAYGISVHPMFAFSSKESVYNQLQEVPFTLEGHPYAVDQWQSLLHGMGNSTVVIDKTKKPMYHAAASLLSNHVVAVLSSGYELLMQCGFSQEEARDFSAALVRNNVEHVLQDGCVEALTGPIERGDVTTVEKHLQALPRQYRELYSVCGKELVRLAEKKHPGQDYAAISTALKG